MTLSKEDAQYFFKLWIPLLDFVNKEYALVPEIYGMASPEGQTAENITKISEKLWENPDIIDKYIAENPDFSAEDLDQLTMWRDHSIQDTFVIDRHVKDGSIFISFETKNVFVVKGIVSSVRDMLKNLPMPQVVKATLIPFKDVIIHDGIVRPAGTAIDKALSDKSKQIYEAAKARDGILDSFL